MLLVQKARKRTRGRDYKEQIDFQLPPILQIDDQHRLWVRSEEPTKIEISCTPKK